ncbi:MAG: V-type ATP synthase subunit A, partial [Nanoarchaeota archaeon]|nr:V-type ATP synthase subunit A [Nanoarchaeota archaeon]
MVKNQDIGKIYRISGPVVIAENISARMFDLVKVGNEKLMGEVIQIDGDRTTIQVYEDTSMVKPGEPVENTGEPLSVELGPGLLSSIYDGIQRPLPTLMEEMGEFIKRGVTASGLDQKKKWDFKPTAKKGEAAYPGKVIGSVEEKEGVIHKIMIPPDKGFTGQIKEIKSGKF